MNAPRFRKTTADERRYVEAVVGGGKVICGRCSATLADFADKCSADLDDACPGFLAIDRAKDRFKSLS